MKPEKIREGLYIKKDRFGYRVVYPYKNEDGSINWFNLLTGGNWYKLIFTVVVVLLILGMSYSYDHDIKACMKFQENLCDYLPNITDYCTESLDLWNTSNLENISFGVIGDEKE